MLKQAVIAISALIVVVCCGCKCSRHLFPVYVNDADGYGYIDRKGTLVIPPRFSYAYDFSEGLACVMDRSGIYLFIDSDGHEVIRPPWGNGYHSIRRFSEGLVAASSLWEGVRFYDLSGKQAFDGEFEKTGDFSCGLAAVKLNGQWGYIDKCGSLAITNRFKIAFDFVNDVAPVANEELMWGIIDKAGNYLVNPTYRSISEQSEGLFVAVTTNGEAIFIDRHGERAIDCTFEVAGEFAEGKAPVIPKGRGIGGKMGFVDRNGQIVIAPRYDYIQGFSEGLAAVEIDGEYGYIDHLGRMAIEPQFAHAEPFKNGLAKIMNGKGVWPQNEGYINKNGEYVWAPRTLEAKNTGNDNQATGGNSIH